VEEADKPTQPKSNRGRPKLSEEERVKRAREKNAEEERNAELKKMPLKQRRLAESARGTRDITAMFARAELHRRHRSWTTRKLSDHIAHRTTHSNDHRTVVFFSLFCMFGSVSATENTTAKTVEVKKVELFKVEFFLKFNCF
jgi:hypothetical protein